MLKPLNGKFTALMVAVELRWIVLVLSSALLFGNYYAFDLPAALNTLLQSHLGQNDADFQRTLNLLYSLYSLPNIPLPFVCGYLMDKLGTRRMLSGLSTLVVGGQFLFSLGVGTKAVWLMYIGRIIFGIGGESLSVSQTQITTKWFRGKELAFALGVNLCLARLGSVFNDIVSPHVAVSNSVSTAVWIGLLTCIFSYGCSAILLYIDASADRNASALTSDSQSVVLRAAGSLTTEPDQLGQDDDRTSSEFEASFHDSFSAASVAAVFPRPPSTIRSVEMQWRAVFSFPLAFWILNVIVIALYATIVPFNTIHGAFLQSKWYPNDPKTAGQVMGIPDTMSAVLVPFGGLFVDYFGHRTKVLGLCGLLMITTHMILGFGTPATVPSPIPALLLLGLAYCLILTFWPCIPLIVHPTYLATAYGLTTSALNASLTIFPLWVAYLVEHDPTYFTTEMFFVKCSLVGILACILLYFVNKLYNGNVLEIPEIDGRKEHGTTLGYQGIENVDLDPD
ncbi:major facilitator superfamily domain-containing protein [Cladochytrium replicatum]|nr:major facilitator superfamily domain-containing protein [Cladochytrium replicatum]